MSELRNITTVAWKTFFFSFLVKESFSIKIIYILLNLLFVMIVYKYTTKKGKFVLCKCCKVLSLALHHATRYSAHEVFSTKEAARHGVLKYSRRYSTKLQWQTSLPFSSTQITPIYYTTFSAATVKKSNETVTKWDKTLSSVSPLSITSRCLMHAN